MADVTLLGCRTLPLLSYLKTLGAFRHVAGADKNARLWWNREGVAVLGSAFDEQAFVDFFLDDYEPTPITSPWNAGSGYYEGKKDKAPRALRSLELADVPRLAGFQQAVTAARRTIEVVSGATGTRIPDDKKALKPRFLSHWRAACPDSALDWIDAALVMEEDGGIAWNPLLGSGGGDGNRDFAGNFALCLVDCLGLGSGGFPSERLLRASLLGDDVPLVDFSAGGMLDPAASGLPNSSSAAATRTSANPWDFVLALEGASLFGGGVARRLSASRASHPFAVSYSARVGASLESSTEASTEGREEATRGEIWLPVWHRPTTIRSLKRLFSEGRAQDGRVQAIDGRAMYRAVADLGTDRGIESFERLVFAKRFGDSYISIASGRSRTAHDPVAKLTRSADTWLARVRPVDSASVRSRVNAVNRLAVELVSDPDDSSPVERWLLALADAELAIARRPASRAVNEPTHIRPLAALDRGIALSLPNTVEYRLALAVAAVGRERDQTGLRQLLEPVSTRDRWRYAWTTDARRGPSLEHALEMLIELAERSRGEIAAVPADRCARLSDVAEFIAGTTDDRAIVRLGFALTLCPPCRQPRAPSLAVTVADRLFAIARLVAGGIARRPGGAEVELRPAPDVVVALAAGNGARAARTAVGRLRADGLVPFRALDDLQRDPLACRRTAAALAFPLHPHDRTLLERVTLTPVEDVSTDEGEIR